MEIKTLGKAQKYYLQLQQLDKEIIEIDKIAKLTVNGSCKINLNYSVEDLSKSEHKNVLDSDGSIISDNKTESPYSILLSWGSPKTIEKPKNIHELKHSLSEQIGLNILAVLLREKQDKRNELIGKLHNLGFK